LVKGVDAGFLMVWTNAARLLVPLGVAGPAVTNAFTTERFQLGGRVNLLFSRKRAYR
jgi:hypothetical protein